MDFKSWACLEMELNGPDKRKRCFPVSLLNYLGDLDRCQFGRNSDVPFLEQWLGLAVSFRREPGCPGCLERASRAASVAGTEKGCPASHPRGSHCPHMAQPRLLDTPPSRTDLRALRPLLPPSWLQGLIAFSQGKTGELQWRG